MDTWQKPTLALTVILPGMESLSDAQAETLRAYVSGGGQVLATWYTSRLDEYGRPCDELALAYLFTGWLVWCDGQQRIKTDKQMEADRPLCTYLQILVQRAARGENRSDIGENHPLIRLPKASVAVTR